MLRLIYLLLSLVALSQGSYCGQSAIPFSIEILSNGQPVLGCARPTCFGWDANGKRAADPAMFYKIGHQMDGFLRSTDKAGLATKTDMFQPQFSICERTYISDRCVEPTQWVGGISPMIKVDSHESMKIMCCTYEKLKDSVAKGTQKLRTGQSIQGGELRNRVGRQHAFEYISSIERMFDEHGVVYTVQMRSFNCVPEPNGPAQVDERTERYLIENINAKKRPKTTTPRPVEKDQEDAKFDEQTFELPEEMPAEEPGVITEIQQKSTDLPPKKLVGDGIPVAQPYEEPVIQETLNKIERQATRNGISDNDTFKARARGAPTLTADTPALVQQQTASVPGVQPLLQSHSPNFFQQPPQIQLQPQQAQPPQVQLQSQQAQPPQVQLQPQQYPQISTNPLDPFGLFGPRNPFGWYIPTSPPTPAAKIPPLEIPAVEEVEKAIPVVGRKIIEGVVRTLDRQH